MAPRTLLICKSVHHGNTQLTAERMAGVLDGVVVDPDDTGSDLDPQCTLIGVGSGIYWGRFHRSIRSWIKRLPLDAGGGRAAFVFSTSGLPFLSCLYHLSLKRALRAKGFAVIGEFSTRGHDTFGPLWLVGGLNRKHPNKSDLLRAEAFARQLVLCQLRNWRDGAADQRRPIPSDSSTRNGARPNAVKDFSVLSPPPRSE